MLPGLLCIRINLGCNHYAYQIIDSINLRTPFRPIEIFALLGLRTRHIPNMLVNYGHPCRCSPVSSNSADLGQVSSRQLHRRLAFLRDWLCAQYRYGLRDLDIAFTSTMGLEHGSNPKDLDQWNTPARVVVCQPHRIFF